jgi:shikimate dehydrogenase
MTIKAAVIGHPIAHSKSPLIHGHWIKTYRCDGSYEAIDIAPEDLKTRVAELVAAGYRGFNVTIPHKQSIMALCETLDDTARAVGAVNTVLIENGVLHGINTDVFGFIENLKNASRNFGYSWSLDNGPALILGAGGAARAAIYGLLQENVPEIIVCNRSPDKAQALCDLGPGIVRMIPWAERENCLSFCNLVVNTTALGMSGKDPLEIDLQTTKPDALVHDIVYAPLYTDFLRQARDYDLRILTGIGMLLHQARPAFESWFGLLPEVTGQLEDLVLA